jgi:Flp pilus assembly protein TadG
MKKLFRSNQKECGQSMVELALTVTFLMILLAGTIDFGRAFFTWIEMRDAAQEGATYASICPTKGDEAKQRIRENLNPIYTYDIYVSPETAQGSTKTVIVKTDLPITMPFLDTVLGSDAISITATINDTILTSECP